MVAKLVQAVVAVLTVSLILRKCGRALWYLVWRPYVVARWFRRQGIQGSPYRLVVGSLPEIRRLLISGRAYALDVGSHDYASLVQPYFQKWASDSGRTFLYWLGPIPSICSTDMEVVKQVLADRTHLFQKDYLNPKFEIIFGKGLIFANGDDWKRHRRVVHPVFNQEKLVMMDHWFSMIKNGNNHQVETDIARDFRELTLTVISRMIYDKNYEDARGVLEQLWEVQALTISSFLDPPVPWFRYLPTRRNRRSRQLQKLTTSSITRLIHERVAKKDGEGGYGDDLLGLMVQAWSDEGTLSIDEIIGECKTFLGAGQDSTANLLSWAMFLLSSYPEWQEKVREEVLRECPNCNEVPSIDALGKLKMNGTSRAANQPNALLGFSYGPRACIGQNFAMIEAQTVISIILKRFSFSLSPKYIHKPTNNLVLIPKYGLPLIVKRLLEDGHN